MEWRKVKNVIILILLLVNGFLLVLVGSRQEQMRRYERTALAQAVQVLEQNGIQVVEEGMTAADGLFGQSVERSVLAEEALARELLGETVAGENRGGGLYTYRGSAGTVSIRSGGEVSVHMEQDDRWYAAEPLSATKSFLSAMDINAKIVENTTENGSGTVTVCQLWQGVPVYSCQLVFTYEGGWLTALSGQLLLSGETAAEESRLLDLPSALLRFLDEVLTSGDVCSEVTALEPGYRMTQSFSGAAHLEPVWLISTNTADYYMDAVTGELSRSTDE